MGTPGRIWEHPVVTTKSSVFCGGAERKSLTVAGAAALGAGGLEFKSPRPDQIPQRDTSCWPQNSGVKVGANLCRVAAECTPLLKRSLQFSLQFGLSQGYGLDWPRVGSTDGIQLPCPAHPQARFAAGGFRIRRERDSGTTAEPSDQIPVGAISTIRQEGDAIP